MMMAASTEDKGFNFNYHDFEMGPTISNKNDDEEDDYDDDDDDDVNLEGGDDITMDVDSFLSILDEGVPDDDSLPLPELPTNPFYPAMDNAENNEPAHVLNDEGQISPSDYGVASEICAEMEQLHASPPVIASTEANESSFGRNNIESVPSQSPNFTESECFASSQDWLSIYNMSTPCPNQSLPNGVDYGLMMGTGAMVNSLKVHSDDSQSSQLWYDDSRTDVEAQAGAARTPNVPVYDFFQPKEPESFLHENYSIDHGDTFNTFDSSSSTTTDEASAEPYGWGLMDNGYVKQAFEMKDEKNEGPCVHNILECKPCETNNKDGFGGFSFDSGAGKFPPSVEAHYSGGVSANPPFERHALAIHKKPANVSRVDVPVSSTRVTFGISSYKMGVGEAVAQAANINFEGTHEACKASLSEDRNDGGPEDDDLCIIEDMSAPARAQSSFRGMSLTPHRSTFSPVCVPSASNFHHMGVSGIRPKVADERLIFQALVHDLSQPKSEANPPDGLLAVPLLRHQRIALSWMMQKETTSFQCSGGILADDQGLGKTISTIALILSERASSVRTKQKSEQGELETLDLDEEDDKQMRNTVSMSNGETSSVRGRPSAGTLIVCPTSVLRQWAEELRTKVTKEAKLSVHVYHGSNRTKDPYELAKHDVVLTTYSIVSMEVPKQPVVVKDGNKQKLQPDGTAASSTKKRKHSSTTEKRCSKRETQNGLIESAARPLAKVGWFRVVLDEAQSIKNHRTQVAQACWGLRAKRRWCLSGTPIQNAIDDLYSYFRFLRYDPYSVYNSFCSLVKVPIAKHPSSGYRKLQAVLRTVMLRRTKGTLLDGEPIISLPPKSITLRKVEFSEEERDFYTKLEADSRAQFQAYADSGTVKQNYVNILLMLLRLRQACDHRLLIQGYDSSSLLSSSILAARKLTREEQFSLLYCLEASLAICGICSDPPEDAVVSICGHVFCNQCISERLTGDDNYCPVLKCKTQLSASSIFSKGTLKNCLSDELSQKGSHVAPESSGELVEHRPTGSFDSSKIKAALEVLQSLSKPRSETPDNVSVDSTLTDSRLADKDDTVSCAPDNGSSIASNGLAAANCVVKEKAIVFSQWTRMLDLLEDCLKKSSIQYRRLDGTMSVVARDKAVRDFNTLPEVSVMIMSLKAASLGLNMVAACHVVLLDLWWNPTTEDQAIDRAHRIGQTRPVTVVRLTVKDTVEDRILALQQKKRELVASAFGEDETGSRQTRLSVEDLKYLFMA